jgi:chromosome segregation ATPase
MKAFLQNLLIFCSLCLCGLIAFQWIRETKMHQALQKDEDVIHDKSERIQNLEQTVKRIEDDNRRLDALQKQLTEIVKSNNVEIAQLNKDLKTLKVENDKNLKQAEAYKEAYKIATNNVGKANEQIETLNAEVRKLMLQQNGLVAKLNGMVTNLNPLTTMINGMATDWSHRGDQMQQMKPAEQREAGVTNMMAMAKDFNTFTVKWNEMQKILAGPAPAAAGTNAPSKQ